VTLLLCLFNIIVYFCVPSSAPHLLLQLIISYIFEHSRQSSIPMILRFFVLGKIWPRHHTNRRLPVYPPALATLQQFKAFFSKPLGPLRTPAKTSEKPPHGIPMDECCCAYTVELALGVQVCWWWWRVLEEIGNYESLQAKYITQFRGRYIFNQIHSSRLRPDKHPT
jgi:hypothetical protein